MQKTYKRRRKTLQLISYILLILNLLLLEITPIAWVVRFKPTTLHIISILTFWLVSIIVLRINELVNE